MLKKNDSTNEKKIKQETNSSAQKTNKEIIKDFLKRQEEYKQQREEELKKIKEEVNKENTFKPTINKKSDKIAMKGRYWNILPDANWIKKINKVRKERLKKLSSTRHEQQKSNENEYHKLKQKIENIKSRYSETKQIGRDYHSAQHIMEHLKNTATKQDKELIAEYWQRGIRDKRYAKNIHKFMADEAKKCKTSEKIYDKTSKTQKKEKTIYSRKKQKISHNVESTLKLSKNNNFVK